MYTLASVVGVHQGKLLDDERILELSWATSSFGGSGAALDPSAGLGDPAPHVYQESRDLRVVRAYVKR